MNSTGAKTFIIIFCLFLFAAAETPAQCGPDGTQPCNTIRRSNTKKKPASGAKKISSRARAAQTKLPSTEAVGGGSSTTTKEEADAMLEAGEKYVDQEFEGEGTNIASPTKNQINDTREVVMEDDTEQRIDILFAELKNNPTARGLVINYGTDREVALREAEIRRAIRFRGYDTNRVKFVRGGGTPGIRTRYFVVPEGAEEPTGEEESQRTENSLPPNVNVGIINSRAISLATPAYPQNARQANAAGVVKVQVWIDENGNVTSAQAISGHALLLSPAEEAARQSRFDPVKIGDRAVPAIGIIVYNFTNQ